MTSWQIKKLGDIGESIIGLTYSPTDVSSDGMDVLRSSNIKDGRIDLADLVRVTANIPQRITLKEGDILVCARNGSRRLIGKNAYINNDIAGKTFGAFMCVYRTIESPRYMHYIFQTQDYKKQIERDLGPTINQVTTGNLNSFKFAFPEKPEQRRIVAVLEVWDEYLELLNRKIVLKEQLKKGLMQQLLTGKKRLPGFTEEWRNVKIGDVVNIAKGRALSSSGLRKGIYPVIAGGKSSPYCHDSYTHENAITISASGAYAGYVAYHNYKIWASDCSVVTDVTHVSDVGFFAHYLKFIQERIYSYQSGGAQPHIYPKDVAIIKMNLPALAEQKAINVVLTSASDYIETMKKARSELISQKKYLLKNLISGTIRTPENLHVKGAN